MILPDHFAAVSGEGGPERQQRTSILSIRLTPAERAALEERAGTKPLGVYIREKALAGQAEKRQTTRKPRLEDAQYASLLASLGESRLLANLNQLAKHANMGTLDVSENVEQELEDACAAVLAMRRALFVALGLKP